MSQDFTESCLFEIKCRRNRLQRIRQLRAKGLGCRDLDREEARLRRQMYCLAKAPARVEVLEQRIDMALRRPIK
jgi:hypothetical protein